MSERGNDDPVDLSAVATESPESATADEQDVVDSDAHEDTGGLVPPDQAQ